MQPDIESCAEVRKFTCPICTDEFDVNSKDFQVKMLDKCKHAFCGECFEEYFRSLIEDQNRHHDLKCPEYTCQARASEQEIKAIIDGDCFAKFKKFQANLLVAQNSNLIFCSTPNCETILEKQRAKVKKLTCPMCKKDTCSGCNLHYHGKGSCEQHRKKQLKGWSSAIKIHYCPKCGC